MLCLLGSPAIREGEQTRPLRLRPKALGLLARVVLDEDPPTREELANLLFGEVEDPKASLRWHLHHLRAQLGPELAARIPTEGRSLRSTIEVDALVFSRNAQRVIGDPGSPDAVEILALYRGDLCGTLAISASPAFDGWLYATQERFRRDFRLSSTAYAQWALRNDRAAGAIEPLSRLVTVEPYFEEGHLLLIRSLEQSDHELEARAAYDRYERILRDELGAAPDPEVAAAYGRRAATAGRRLPSDRFVSLKSLTLHVIEWPGGEPAVLAIHGSGMTAYSMTALGERISPDFKFVAADLKGSGFSDKPPSGYTVEGHAADLIELSRILHLANPVLLGFSIGGTVATLAASRIGARGLILLEGVVGPEAFTRNAAAQVVGPIGSAYELTFGGFDQYLKEWRSGQPSYSSDAEKLLEAMVRFELAPVGGGRVRRRGLRAALEETWRSAVEVDTLSALSALTCPVLIVQATEPWIDGRPYFDDEIIGQQLRAARKGSLLVASHSDHPRLARDPEPLVIEGIKEFLGALRAPR